MAHRVGVVVQLACVSSNCEAWRSHRDTLCWICWGFREFWGGGWGERICICPSGMIGNWMVCWLLAGCVPLHALMVYWLDLRHLRCVVLQ